VRPLTLDHVALWVADRERVAAAAIERLGLRVIERTDRFTLLGGSDARRGKLTLFDAEGPRARGALKRIAFRVPSLEGREPVSNVGEGIELALVETDLDVDLDLDHVVLEASDVDAAVDGWEELGFARVGDARLEVGGAYVDIVPGSPGVPERPLLNHLAVLVDSVEEHHAAAEELGVEIDDLVDAPNTIALFVYGPDRVRLEYVEHKASFSLT
jgi:catechol 2,3-dioxygenase-like lactoylglutathione lyase family enzyme